MLAIAFMYLFFCRCGEKWKWWTFISVHSWTWVIFGSYFFLVHKLEWTWLFWALKSSQFFSKNLSNFPTISEFFTKQQQIVISVIIWLYKNPIFTRPLRYIYLHTPDTKTRSHRSSKFVNFVEKKKHITYCTSLPVQNENIYVIYVSNTRYNLACFFWKYEIVLSFLWEVADNWFRKSE